MHSINTIIEWCESHQGQTIQIQKREDQDLDIVVMELSKATAGALDPHNVDSYLSDQAIYLHGSAAIDGSATAQMVTTELPGDIYVIPLEGSFEVQPLHHQLVIRSERAQYILSSTY
ncbi:hypothetical protein [Marinicrinis lubricantis]|uniref:Uncharacterized protein n=1 Tax=Marinicrinis lubricantis TaxID=2086470 RepID=A0ABW1ILC6_9BACL